MIKNLQRGLLLGPEMTLSRIDQKVAMHFFMAEMEYHA